MASLRHDLKTFRTLSTDLLSMSGMPPGPRTLTPPDTLLGALRAKVDPAPLHTTKSDSTLFTYTGPVLAIRQVVLHTTAATGQPLPPGFADAPPRLLAIMGLTLPRALVNVPHRLPFTARPKLTGEALTLIDLWESSGLGWLARPGFLLSHVWDGDTEAWVPLTPRMEGFLR
jgi:hypothetical protein